jgi:hypothetical protein
MNTLLTAQTIKGRIMDSTNGNPVVYAHVFINNKSGAVSNQEGFFKINIDEGVDSVVLKISALGYENLEVTVQVPTQDLEISMKPNVFQLDEVVVGNSLSPRQIIQKYTENVPKNHFIKDQRMRVFTRTQDYFLPNELDIELLKISFDDKGKFQNKINQFTSEFRDKKAVSFTEKLFDVYFSGKKYQVHPLKALKLKPDNVLDLDNFQEKFFMFTFKSLESPYTYKIKSGWIPIEREVSLQKMTQEASVSDTLNTKNAFLHIPSSYISHLEFIKKPDLYDYTLEGIVDVQGFSCYHISFVSAGRKGKYKGNLYINEEDFAMIRYQYGLEDGKREFGLNLKWVLGIKVQENENTHEVQFAKSASGFYYPIFSRKSASSYAYVHRGLSMKENHPKRSLRKILKLDFKIEMTTRQVEEKVVMEVTSVDPQEVEKMTFPTFVLYDVQNQYDPLYWHPYPVLEATKEIKRID